MTDPTITTVASVPTQRGELRDIDAEFLKDAIQRGHEMVADRIPVHYQNSVVTQPDVEVWVRELVAASRDNTKIGARISRGRSLLLVGPTGCGKTFEAYGAVRALAVSGASFSWMFISAADCYARLRPRPGVDSEEEFERYSRVGLLILDDLGAAKGSEWTEEINYRLVNYRYERELPTLVTSNVPPKNLAAALGERVASRLSEMATRIVLSGPDRRLR